MRFLHGHESRRPVCAGFSPGLPLYFKTKSVFAQVTGNTKQLEDRYAAIAGNYDPCAQMRLVTFLDNHDQNAPGCLVLDVAMPHINGLELQQAIAASGSE